MVTKMPWRKKPACTPRRRTRVLTGLCSTPSHPAGAAHGSNIDAAIPIVPVNHSRPHPAAGGGEHLLVDSVDTSEAGWVKQPPAGGAEAGKVVAGDLGDVREVVRIGRSGDGSGVGPPGEELFWTAVCWRKGSGPPFTVYGQRYPLI
jgi:hypothetical protein